MTWVTHYPLSYPSTHAYATPPRVSWTSNTCLLVCLTDKRSRPITPRDYVKARTAWQRFVLPDAQNLHEPQKA